MSCEVEDENLFYWYNGAAWANIASAIPAATETQAGVAELATQAETIAGTDDARIVTPLKLQGKLLAQGSATQINDTHSPYTVLATDRAIEVDANAGPVQVNLPASAPGGREIIIYNLSGAGNDVTIDGDGIESVGILQGGGGTLVLSDGQGARLFDTNLATAEWFVLAYSENQKLGTEDLAEFTGVRNVGGDLSGNVTPVVVGDSPYTILATDNIIVVDSSGGPVQLDLPASGTDGRRLTVIRAGGSDVTINASGGENVNGAGTYVMAQDGECVRVVDANAAGAEWSLVNAGALADLVNLKTGLTLTPGAEAANVIAVVLASPDASVQHYKATVYDPATGQALDTVATVDEAGAGAEVWPAGGGQASLIFTTGPAGAATLNVTDVAGASSKVMLLEVVPVHESGEVRAGVAPTFVTLTFDGV
jgi:hypothetical protein